MSHPLYQMKICLCKMSKSKKGINIYLCIVMFGIRSDDTFEAALKNTVWQDIKKRCILNPYKLVPLLAYSFCIYKSSFSRGVICATTSQGMEKEFFWMCLCVRWNSRKCIFVCPPHCSKSIIMINLNYINILKACQKCKIFHDD